MSPTPGASIPGDTCNRYRAPEAGETCRMARARRFGRRRSGNSLEFDVDVGAGSPSGQDRTVEDCVPCQGVRASTKQCGERPLALDVIFRLESDDLSVDTYLTPEYLS